MIRFALTCPDGHNFEGWFKSNAAFDDQAAAGHLTCPICGGDKIRKAIMAPAVARTDRGPSPRALLERQAELQQARAPAEAPPVPAPPAAPPMVPPSPEVLARMLVVMRAVKEHVERNFNDVGAQFPEEARKIHYGEVEARGIYGRASSDEVKELLEEGIEIMPLPMVPKLDD